MTYTVTITNSKIGMTSAQILYLSTISPSLIVNPDKPYEEYVSDVKLDSTDIYVPLYKRNQLVKLPANSVLVIYTEDSEEAAYYKSQRLDGSSVLVDPDPITGDSIVDSLKNLYVALGNDASSVENANTILEVLNVMSESYQGESNASSISDAVDNIAAVADNISGGGGKSNTFSTFFASLEDRDDNYGFGFVTPTDGELKIDMGDYGVDGYPPSPEMFFCVTAPLKKITIDIYQGFMYFVPTEDFDGIYYSNGTMKKNLTGDPVVKDGNAIYQAYFNSGPDVDIKKCETTYAE